MCHFISWIELNKEIYFLDDLKLNTKEGRKLLNAEYKDDILGHGAIRHYYPELGDRGKDYECEYFSSPDNFPGEIVEAIKKGLFRGFSVATGILTESAWAEYDKIERAAWAEYEEIEQSALAEKVKIGRPAWAEYGKITRAASAEYGKIRESALDEYKKIEQAAWAEYMKITRSAGAEYNKIKQAAWGEYLRITRAAFWDIAVQKKNRKRNWK